MELFRLFGSILIDDKDAIASLKKVDSQGKSTKSGLSDIVKKGAVIGTAIVGGCTVAVGGLLSLANSTSESAAKWLELSQRTDIGIESLQRWGYAAGQSGADIEKLEVGMKKLSTSMVDAQNGSEKAKSAYEALGISMSDLSTMTPEQAFDTVMAKLADMPDSAEKNVIGNQLLGKSYTELKTLLSEGSDGMEELKNKADELGIVMSEESVVAAEGYGDSMDNIKLAFEGIKNKLMASLMPKLTELADWFVASLPTIQGFVTNALDKVSAGIQWISDNSNILLPILASVVAVFTTMQIISVISGLITAWNTVTTVATGIQAAFNAVMAANPIALVIIAITSLIAIGVLLYQNWDTIKQVCADAFAKVQEVISGAVEKIKGFFNQVIDFVKNNWQGLLLLIINPFAGAFKLAYDNCEGFRNKVNDVFGKIKEGVSTAVNAVKTTISTVFGTIKDIMANPFEAAKTAIETVINKIKGFLNFKWEFPKLKMPHFKVSGSMNPMDWVSQGVPKLTVDWYAKGGIFSKPTLFNTPYGLKGVGEAGPEAVAPLSDLREMLGLDNQKSQMPELIDAILALAGRENVIAINGKEIVRQTAQDMSKELASLNKVGSRKVGVLP